jgi:hypothetical protein
MDEKSILSFISDNAIAGATGSAALAFLYKIWRILQSDRKVDSLDNAERSFRDEMREEIKALKDDRRRCEEGKEQLYNQVHALQKQMAEFQVGFNICKISHPHSCPLILNRPSRENPNGAA